MDIRSPDIMKTSMERRSISRRDIMKRTRKVFPFSFLKSTFFLHKKKNLFSYLQQDTKQKKGMMSTMVIMRNMARRVDLSITRNGDTKNPNINHFPDKTKFLSTLCVCICGCATAAKLQQKPLIHFLTFVQIKYSHTYNQLFLRNIHMFRLYA